MRQTSWIAVLAAVMAVATIIFGVVAAVTSNDNMASTSLTMGLASIVMAVLSLRDTA